MRRLLPRMPIKRVSARRGSMVGEVDSSEQRLPHAPGSIASPTIPPVSSTPTGRETCCLRVVHTARADHLDVLGDGGYASPAVLHRARAPRPA